VSIWLSTRILYPDVIFPRNKRSNICLEKGLHTLPCFFVLLLLRGQIRARVSPEPATSDDEPELSGVLCWSHRPSGSEWPVALHILPVYPAH